MFLVSQPVKEKIRVYRSCLVHLAQRIVPTTVMVKQGILDAQFSTNLCCAQVRFGPLPTLWLQALFARAARHGAFLDNRFLTMTREAIPQSEELAEVVSADKGSFSDAYAGSASNKLLLSFLFFFLWLESI